MPVPSWLYGNTLGTLGGTFPAGPTLGGLGADRQPGLTPYLGAFGPRSITGPPRGSPGGLPMQAREAPNLMLTRERLQRALEDEPALAAQLARNRSAEIGPNAKPEEQAFYDALVLDRTAARGDPLASTLRNPSYFPSQTLNYRGAVNPAATDPAIWEGANPANFATGNASLDPATGRWVGFGGGPQTATIRSGRGMELGGIEKPDLPYARAVGYLGPDRTAIGPGGPLGMDMANLSPTGGWETTVSAQAPGTSGSGGGDVGYIRAERAARPATTDPAELRPKAADVADNSSFLGRFLENLDFTPAKSKAAATPPPFTLGNNTFQFKPLKKRGNRATG